jgi:hypothetical protein
MTEKEYIDVEDLTRARTLEEVMRGMLPSCDSFIDKEEYAEVREIVRKWVDAGFKAIQPLVVNENDRT